MLEMVCIDVDGTLVGSDNTVRADVWDALAALRSDGVHLVLCSGRPAFGMAREFAERIEPGGWHVFQNGASIVQVQSGESLSAPFPEEAEAQLKAAAESSGFLLERYTDFAYETSRIDDRARKHAELLGTPLPPLFTDPPEGQAVRLQWLVDYADEARARELTPPELSLHPAGSPNMRRTLFLSATAPGISKGSAITRVAKAYGVSLARTMMVGDGSNDLQALQTAGFAVAMGNAEPAVLKAAKYHVGHVDRGGLLEALALARSL